MCLIKYNDMTRNLADSSEEVFTFYKIYSLLTKVPISNDITGYAPGITGQDEDIYLSSAWRSTIVAAYKDVKPDEPIIHSSDRYHKELGCDEQTMVSHGIHVFISEKDALLRTDSKRQICIPVKCRKEDLVAAGTWVAAMEVDQAVFMKIEINSNDVIKAIETVKAKKAEKENVFNT